MAERGIGYTLLIVGLLLILITIFSVYGVFTGMFKPYQLFRFSSIGLDTSAFIPQELTGQGFTPATQKAEFLPANVLNDSSNIFAHVVFMGFIAGAGQKIASIRTQLIRTIKLPVS